LYGINSLAIAMIEYFTKALVAFLTKPSHGHSVARPTDLAPLSSALRPGDVLLVEGNSRISTAIKYLTQSTWSHAALYVGEAIGERDETGALRCFVEADVAVGVRAVSLEAFQGYQCRVCRPIGLDIEDARRVVNYALSRLGHRYDLKNVFDLARYLIPTPPVRSTWRRRMIALGSGDPTRAICSTLIAQAFETISYPILPLIANVDASSIECPGCVEEILHIRHHSLYVPRDFDVSPYFEIVKPTLAAGFDFHQLKWARSELGAVQ
jgi:hypothetical protein